MQATLSDGMDSMAEEMETLAANASSVQKASVAAGRNIVRFFIIISVNAKPVFKYATSALSLLDLSDFRTNSQMNGFWF